MNFERLKITSGKHWDVFLHEDQTTIGRLYFWYKGDASDLLDVSEEAFSEFYRTAKMIKDALIGVFQPDMFNYLSLGNRTKHLHIHLIPRYSRELRLFDTTFKDAAYGSGYKRDLDLNITEEVLLKIKSLIIEALTNQNQLAN